MRASRIVECNYLTLIAEDIQNEWDLRLEPDQPSHNGRQFEAGQVQIASVRDVDQLLGLTVVIQHHTARHLNQVTTALDQEFFDLIVIEANKFLVRRWIDDRLRLMYSPTCQ